MEWNVKYFMKNEMKLYKKLFRLIFFKRKFEVLLENFIRLLKPSSSLYLLFNIEYYFFLNLKYPKI